MNNGSKRLGRWLSGSVQGEQAQGSELNIPSTTKWWLWWQGGGIGDDDGGSGADGGRSGGGSAGVGNDDDNDGEVIMVLMVMRSADYFYSFKRQFYTDFLDQERRHSKRVTYNIDTQ